MTIAEAAERDRDEEARCLAALRAVRWPLAVVCPRCGGSRHKVHSRQNGGRRKLFCFGCARTFNELTGTPFANSKLPLSLWFRCAARMSGAEPTCEELAGRLGVRLATAWRMRGVMQSVLADPVMGRAFGGLS